MIRNVGNYRNRWLYQHQAAVEEVLFIIQSQLGFISVSQKIQSACCFTFTTRMQQNVFDMFDFMRGGDHPGNLCLESFSWVVSVCFFTVSSWWVSLVCVCGRTPAQGWGRWRTGMGHRQPRRVEWVTSVWRGQACCSAHCASNPTSKYTPENDNTSMNLKE